MSPKAHEQGYKEKLETLKGEAENQSLKNTAGKIDLDRRLTIMQSEICGFYREF